MKKCLIQIIILYKLKLIYMERDQFMLIFWKKLQQLDYLSINC